MRHEACPQLYPAILARLADRVRARRSHQRRPSKEPESASSAQRSGEESSRLGVIDPPPTSPLAPGACCQREYAKTEGCRARGRATFGPSPRNFHSRVGSLGHLVPLCVLACEHREPSQHAPANVLPAPTPPLDLLTAVVDRLRLSAMPNARARPLPSHAGGEGWTVARES